MSKSKKKSAQNQTQKHEREWYVTAVTDTRLWFDKATELLLLAEIVEKRIKETWVDARKNIPSNVVLKVEDIVRHIEEEKKKDKWPIQAQGLYLAMVAYAIENLCKADIIRANKQEITEEIKNNGELPKRLNKHDLIDLVKQVGLAPNEQEQVLLRHLENKAVWAARYPVPTKAYRKISPSEYLKIFYDRASSPEEYIDHIKSLVSKISQKIRANSQGSP